MRNIDFDKIVKVVEKLCIEAAYELAPDVVAALEKAERDESNVRAKNILGQLLENARIASEEKIPLCQDTGLAVVFVEMGSQAVINDGQGRGIYDAINTGVACGYEKGLLRKSVVCEPLNERINTGTNTPAIIHYTVVDGDKIKITFMAKGGGCENKSRFKMFNPTAEKKSIIDWVVEVVKEAGANACPPFVIGVGIGGDFELSCLLSKKALLREVGQKSADKFYADLEEDLLLAINSTGLGAQGLGGDITALGCAVEFAACHIASMPVAVNIECHSHRHKAVVI